MPRPRLLSRPAARAASKPVKNPETPSPRRTQVRIALRRDTTMIEPEMSDIDSSEQHCAQVKTPKEERMVKDTDSTEAGEDGSGPRSPVVESQDPITPPTTPAPKSRKRPAPRTPASETALPASHNNPDSKPFLSHEINALIKAMETYFPDSALKQIAKEVSKEEGVCRTYDRIRVEIKRLMTKGAAQAEAMAERKKAAPRSRGKKVKVEVELVEEGKSEDGMEGVEEGSQEEMV